MPEEPRKRANKGWFRPGEVQGAAAARQRDIGHETVRGDGKVYVKVDDHRASSAADRMHRWKQRAHVVWEKEHGPLPDGWIVTHADHDALNDAPENLVAAPRKLMAIINRRGFAYHDIGTLQTAVLMASVLHEASTAEKDAKEERR